MDKDKGTEFKYVGFKIALLHVETEKLLDRVGNILKWKAVSMIKTGKYGTIEPSSSNLQEACAAIGMINWFTIEEAKKAWNEIEFGPIVQNQQERIITSVKTTNMIEFINGKISPELFLLLCAVKSVIGPKRNFTLTYNSVLSYRMYGIVKKIPRYTMDKLFQQGTNRGLFCRLPAARGFYVSTRYQNPLQFAEKITARIIKYRDNLDQMKKATESISQIRKSYKIVENSNKNDSAPIYEK